MSNNKQKYLASRRLWRHLMTVLGRAGLPGILLTHWVSACFSHLLPEGQESGWYPFFHGQPLPPRGAEGGSAGAAEVWWDRAEEPSLHPSHTRGWFHRSPRREVTWEGRQWCSWTTLPNSSARSGFLQLLWGNSPVSPKIAQQVDTSWPSSPRCAACPFTFWTTGESSQTKPIPSTSKKLHCSGGADKIPQPRA